ncbi:hypothetical protein BJV74DRAFT_799492 [Russula compacta]|nr:hypothetical protein BJV74DRAFT_799492 [Russula compacta]
MVNPYDFSVLTQDGSVVVKLWHALSGLYIWELLTTLDYELSVIWGRKPYRWTIWIYSFTRAVTLVTVTLGILFMDIKTPLNCQLWVSLILDQALIEAVSIAIWDKHEVVMVTAISIWGINVGFLVLSAARFRDTWVSEQLACEPLNTSNSKVNLIFMVATDIALLFIMLIGLLRLRRRGGGRMSLTHLLWKQRVIWLLVAILAEVPSAVLVILNLNDPFNVVLSLVTKTIAATWIHRCLVDFGLRASDVYDILHLVPLFFSTAQRGRWYSSVRKNNQIGCPMPVISKTQRPHAAKFPSDRMKVAVHTVYEQHSTPQSNDRISELYANTEGSVHRNSIRLRLDDEVGRGI